MLETAIGAGVLDPPLTAVLHVGAGSLTLRHPVAAVMFETTVSLRIPYGAAMALRHLSIWHAYPPKMLAGDNSLVTTEVHPGSTLP
jgi:hypothetical protein